jgi:uncharacterized protein YjbI with pentapeptide repeats
LAELETNKTTEALLASANSASERVSRLHIAFIAVCVYVLAIVFSTTDLDLLIGKGIRLPAVNVDVSIVGFYTFAPYIVVLVHFNLLLQLQFLSQKLFIFDVKAPQQTDINRLRDRLHIFPFNYYLIGLSSSLLNALVAIMVSITVVILPIATLLAIQLQFLAYQSEVATWLQRIATWLDILFLIILWPMILDFNGDWFRYWHNLITAHIPQRRMLIAYVMLLAGFILLLFNATQAILILGVILVLLSPFLMFSLYGWGKTPRSRYYYLLLLLGVAVILIVGSILILIASPGVPVTKIIDWLKFKINYFFIPLLFVPLSLLWHPQAPRGSHILLLSLFIGFIAPLAMLADGDGIEQIILQIQKSDDSSSWFSKTFLYNKRRLNLAEQVLLAKQPKTEVLALLRSNNWRSALQQLEPINLQDRNLRHAYMYKCVLIGGDLRRTQFQGAELSYAKFQGADLAYANFQSAQLTNAEFQNADLSFANFQGAKLFESQLQGTDLKGAQLQAADLGRAQVQGANLYLADLRGASMVYTQLQGVNLNYAKLQGGLLAETNLQGADLSAAELYGIQDIKMSEKQVGPKLITGLGIHWTPMDDKNLSLLADDLERAIPSKFDRQQFLDRIKKASKLHVQSCFASSDTPLICDKRFDPDKPKDVSEYERQLHTYLVQLACQSPEIARGILRQIPKWEGRSISFSRDGLEVELNKWISDKNCLGLYKLSDEEKNKLRAIQ